MSPRRSFSLVLLLSLAALIVACSDFVNRTKKTEYAGAQLVDGGMRTYAAYWKAATNDPPAYNRSLDGLLTERSNILVRAKQVGAGLTALDSALDIYATNAAAGKPVVEAALAAFLQDSANLAAFLFSLTNR